MKEGKNEGINKFGFQSFGGKLSYIFSHELVSSFSVLYKPVDKSWLIFLMSTA